MTNRGKAFEKKFEEDWKRVLPESFLIRLYDTTGGYLSIATPCDFVAFAEGKLFLIECKSIEGGTLNFSYIPQYDRLLKYKNLKGVYPGIVVWFKDHDKVIWCPIEEAEKIKADGNKSISLKYLDGTKYHLLEIPSIKKRVFLDSDYSVLIPIEK